MDSILLICYQNKYLNIDELLISKKLIKTLILNERPKTLINIRKTLSHGWKLEFESKSEIVNSCVHDGLISVGYKKIERIPPQFVQFLDESHKIISQTKPKVFNRWGDLSTYYPPSMFINVASYPFWYVNLDGLGIKEIFLHSKEGMSYMAE